LTDSQTLFGEDRLFATLDTTTHHAILPSASRVILADTIGFIMDLPVKLFLSFSATLQHVENAVRKLGISLRSEIQQLIAFQDLLIHVMDLAHPDLLAQRDNVFETLQNLRIRQFLIDSIVNVGNKLDKCDQARKEGLLKWGILPQGDNDEPNYQQHGTGMSSPIFPISCRTMEGMSELIKQLDKVIDSRLGSHIICSFHCQSVQLLNGNRLRRLQLAHSSKAIPYLYEHGFIRVPPAPTECGNYLLIDVNMNDEQFSKFRTAIGTRFKRKDGQKRGEVLMTDS
jgi:50S ribosomal subunit-associated GTPase HflX